MLLDSRVLIPAGTYRIVSLFLKDDVNIELAEGAVLSAYTDRTRFPVFQGMIQSYDEQGEYNLGTWEGNPLPMFTGKRRERERRCYLWAGNHRRERGRQ